MSLGLWGGPTDDELVAQAEAALDEIAALGATDVALVVAWGQRDVRAAEVAPSSVTVSDEVIRAAIDAAHARGLRVLVFPILVLEVVRTGEWRGTLRPRDADAWWSSYERFVLHHARLAADAGAAALSIGSELGSTEAWRDRWFHLISRVEKVFTGELGYSANWDHYEHPSFWKRLDWIGVTGYFELTRDDDATTKALTDAWAAPRDALLAFADGLGKPLVLTEVGYPSVDGGAVRPWDYGRDGDGDLEEQRRAFAALAAAWDGTALAGVYVWEWGHAQYTPKDKPAAKVLRCWWAATRRSSPSATSGSPARSARPTPTTR